MCLPKFGTLIIEPSGRFSYLLVVRMGDLLRREGLSGGLDDAFIELIH